MPVPTNRATLDVVQASDINAMAALLNLLEAAGADGSGLPAYYIKPSSTSVDIGPLINSALQTYGVAIVAALPDPNTFWSCSTPIEIGTNETLMGMGMGTSRIRASGTFPTSASLVRTRAGNSAGFRISGLMLHGNGRAVRAIGLEATAAPDGNALTTPDSCPVIEDIHARGATGDGIYVGGNNSYSGNFREARVRHCLVVGNGGWGLTCASSDMFVHDVTAHGNGPGGIRTVSGQAGNAKLLHCKSYFEAIGIQSGAVRVSIVGGEVQDCNNGITVAADSFVSTTIDSCGDGSVAALRVTGGGCTFAVHMTSRVLSSQPSTMETAVQLDGSGQTHGGFINTNFQTAKYNAIWRGSNRPSPASSLVVS